jgi:hypothetical protein
MLRVQFCGPGATLSKAVLDTAETSQSIVPLSAEESDNLPPFPAPWE